MKSKSILSTSMAGAVLASVLGLTESASLAKSAAAAPRFNMVAFAEIIGDNGQVDQHKPYVDAAKIWLNQLAKDSNFTVTYLENPNSFTDSMLSKVDLLWQMNYPPYMWDAGPKAAFEKYMNEGRGGWIGVHHATLYGSLVTNQTWPFFYKLIGQISFKGYISKFASGNIRLEEAAHPVFKDVPATFNVTTEEWYTYDKDPRPNVHVLANVDESSYKFTDPSESGIKMGDHPVIWTNDQVKSRNIYIFMGHSPNLFQNTAYTTLLRNSIMWAANKPAAALGAKPAGASGVPTGKSKLRIKSRTVTIVSQGKAGQPAVHNARGQSLSP